MPNPAIRVYIHRGRTEQDKELIAHFEFSDLAAICARAITHDRHWTTSVEHDGFATMIYRWKEIQTMGLDVERVNSDA